MKKLLLLLMAVLLFAPPRANAAAPDPSPKTMTLYEQANNSTWTCTTTSSSWSNGAQYIDATLTNNTSKKGSAMSGTNASFTIGKIVVNKTTANTGSSWLHFPTTNYPITIEISVNANYTQGTYGALKYSTGSSSSPNKLQILPSTKMSFSIQFGTIQKVEIVLTDAKALLPVDETKTEMVTSDNITYTFSPKGDNKEVVIKRQNIATATAYTIKSLKITYLEGEPTPPAVPTIDILSLQQPTTAQGKERNYGYKLDTENKVLTVTGQPQSYRMLEIKDYSKLSEKVNDATGIAYTFSETANLPTAVANIKNSNDPKTGWVPANATLASDAAQIGISPALPTDDTWDNWNKKIRFISYSSDLISESDLSLDIVLNRVAAPEIDIDKTNAIEGQEYNPVTGVLSYTNYPVIMLKTETEYGNKDYIVTKYIDHNGDEQTYDPNLNESKDNWRLELDNRTAGIPQYNGVTNEIKLWSYVKTYNMPVTGSATTSVTTYADTNKDKPLTITLRSNSTNIPAKPTFAAPKINIDGKFDKLSGNVMGYINKPVITVKSGGVVGDANDTTTGVLLYQLSESFAQTPLDDKDAFTSPTDISKNWTVAGETGTITLPDNFTGRVFFKELYQTTESYFTGDYASTTTFRDFQKINTESISDLSIDNLKTNVAEGTVVTLDKDMYVTGVYTTNNATNGTNVPVVIYLQDAEGNALQLNAECTEDEKADYESWSGKKFAAGSISGVLRGQGIGLPALSLNTSTIDYTNLIGNPVEATNAPEITEVSTLNIADYGKLVFFSHFTYNGDDTFTDKDGNTFTAIDQLNSTPDWEQKVDDVESIKADMAGGVEYRIKGYVGYSSEYGPVILPLAVVPSVRLLAPNPVNTEANSGETIKMNMISDALDFTVDKTGFDPNVTRLYLYNEDHLLGNSQPQWDLAKGHKFSLRKYMFENIKKTTITVKFKLINTSTGIESEPVTVEITMHDITPDKCVDNIKDFKDLFINTDNLPETGADNVAANPDNYYRLQEEQGGYARIREVSDKYLYIRTNLEDESQLSNQELSDHSILLYNKHGWEKTLVAGVEATIAPAAVAEGDTEEEPADLAAYTLKPGDIITNFALIPTRSGYGNLIADISDFTRTIRRVEGVDAGHNDPITVEAADFAGFTDADRMLRYRVEDVMVKKVPDSSEKGFYYYLDIPGKPVFNNGGVFEELTGWDVMQDDNAVFNLEGVVMLANGDIEEGQDGRYMFALVPPTDDNEDDYNIMPRGVAPGAPVITISGDFTDNENGTFLTKANVTIKADAEGATNLTIYYTDDDSDPRTNSAAKLYKGPFTISKNTVIKAFATAKGAPNSEVSGAYFERTLTESKYVINFILGAQKDVPYHFTGNVRVAAKGGDYFFVRGTQGHYLPINVKNNSIDLSKVNVGGYINDMVITPHIVATNGRNIVRGAHITPEYKSLFTGYSDTRPGTLKEDIMIEPDSVTTLTVDNARRFVKLSGVELKIETDGTDAQATTQWTLKTDKGDGAEIRVNHNILEPEFDFNKVDDNAYYNVTGFAMLGTDGVIELWPTKVEQINNTLPVAATVTGNIISQIPGTADNPDVSAEFYPYTTVNLAPTGHGSAVIYYWISKDKKEAIPADAQWNVYSQEFAVTKSCYIHAMAIRPGYEASVHTHINLTLAQPAQPVDFSVDPQAGKTVVTMTAAAGAKIFWSTDKKTWNEYTAPVPFTQQTTVYAYAKEGNRNSATVSMFVMIQTTGGTADASKMSGKLTISHRLDEENSKYLITIAPEDESLAEGTYTIHYTTDGTTPTVNSTMYNGEFEMPKTGGVVLAILKEHTKEYPGEVAHLNISYIPTGIDGIDSDRDDSDAVRAEGGNIIAPEGSEVYDITGRRVATTGLRSGIYIVKVPGAKAVKVKVD